VLRFFLQLTALRFQQLAASFPLFALFFKLAPFIIKNLQPLLPKTGGA